MAFNRQIIIAHYTLPPVVGGVENMLEPLARIFAQNGYLVTLLAGEGEIEGHNIKTSLIPELNPEYHHVRNIQRIMRLGSLPESYEVKLHNFLRKIETEVGDIEQIVIHNIMTMPFNLTATEAFWNFMDRNPQKRFYIWTHDLAWLMNEYQDSLYQRRPWSLLKTARENVTYITVSESRRRQMVELLNIPRRNIRIVPNALKFEHFLRFCDSTSVVIRELDLFHRYPVILIPTRILPRKNIERCIDIVAQIAEALPNALGVITGIMSDEKETGSAYCNDLRSYLTSRNLAERVVFLDDLFPRLNISRRLNREVVHDLYFVSHLVLLLSSDEGFGLPILEAGAARTPIAVSSIPVFREVAGEGALFLSLDETAAVNATRLAKFLSEYQSRSDLLFKRVLNDYNQDRWWDNYLSEIFEG